VNGVFTWMTDWLCRKSAQLYRYSRITTPIAALTTNKRMSKTKLELTWIGKDKRPKLEPRILLEDPSLSYHAKHRVSDNDHFDNKLIFGDNLLALKALEQEYAGKVKCVFIDPP
jgi:hypothetical protein